MKLEELQEESLRLQELLRLQDWHIKTMLVHAKDMASWQDDGFDLGESRMNQEHKTARIKLLYPNEAALVSGWEEVPVLKTLIHEYLEIHIDPITSPDKVLLKEQAINAIADCIYELMYGTK